MGGVSTVVQAVLAAGFIAEGVAEVVLQEKIRKIMSQHQEEFKLMNQIMEFVDKITKSQYGLEPQLSVNVLFVKDNWNTIYESFEEKTELLNFMSNIIPGVKIADFDYAYKSGHIFGASILASAYIAYSYIAGRQKTSVSSDFANFRTFFSQTSTIVRSSQPSIFGANLTYQGLLFMQYFGTDFTSLPDRIRTSKVNSVKLEQKNGTSTSKAVKGVKLFLMAADIYKFVYGIIVLVDLKKTLDAHRKYFQEEGAFEKAEQGALELMTLTAADVVNFANSSRTAIFQSKNMLLVKSVTLPMYNETVLAYSKRLDAEGFGLTDQFFINSQNLANNCNTVLTSGKALKYKLEDMRDYVDKYFKLNDPTSVFLNISTNLSKVMGEYSISSTSINQNQHSINRFLSRTAQIFQYKRDQNFHQKPVAQKKTIDTAILTQTFQKYVQIFDLNLNLANLDQFNKDILFQSIVSFADQFYYDDDTGRTFFGKNIGETKSKVSYRELLENMLIAQANVIPVRRNKEEDEKKETDQWVGIAKELNRSQNYRFWKQDDQVVPVFRYLRLRVENQAKKSTKDYKALSSFEGIRVRVNQQFFQAQRSALRGTKTLKQA